MSGISQSDTLEAEFQLYLKTDSAQKSPRSAAGDAYFLGIALYYFNDVHQLFYVEQIRLEHLQMFQIWLISQQTIQGGKIKEPWGDTTIEFYCRILKKFFRKMHDTDRIAKNPCRLWKVPKGTGKERQPMSKEQYAKLYAAAPEWFKPIAEFMHLTGSRGVSIAALTWGDIDFEKRQLFLKSRKGGLKKLKMIPFFIYDQLLTFLEKELIAVADDERPPRASDPVFWGPRGLPVTAQQISSEGSRLNRKVLGLPPDVVLYSLRHAIGMELAEADVSLETARQILGHSSVTQTQRYSNKIAARVMGTALSKIRGKDET